VKVAFVDTSCFVAIALDERTAGAVERRLLSFDRLAASPLLEADLRAVLHREGGGAAVSIAPWLDGLYWVTPQRALSAEIAAVLAAGYARGADCWHLASALFFASEPAEITFLTLDKAQQKIARALGFET
jgi:uncharacterized protein with PIN domain